LIDLSVAGWPCVVTFAFC